MFDNSECYWHQTTVVFILQSPMFVSSAKKKEKTEKTTPKRKKCNPYLVSIVNNELDRSNGLSRIKRLALEGQEQATVRAQSFV